jgi:hypothetical protein
LTAGEKMDALDKDALNKEELEQIESLINFTDNWFEKNKKLVEDLKLRKKMLGFLGEIETVKVLYDKFGDKISGIPWPGAGKKGYDIEIMPKVGNPIRIQVKTSMKAAFRVINVGGADKYREEIEKAYNSTEPFVMPSAFAAEISKQIDDTKADYWILIDWPETGKRFFILTKEEVKQIVVKDYERYMNHRKSSNREHNRSFNYSITSSRAIGIIVHYKDWKENYFEKCKDKWEKLKI